MCLDCFFGPLFQPPTYARLDALFITPDDELNHDPITLSARMYTVYYLKHLWGPLTRKYGDTYRTRRLQYRVVEMTVYRITGLWLGYHEYVLAKVEVPAHFSNSSEESQSAESSAKRYYYVQIERGGRQRRRDRRDVAEALGSDNTLVRRVACELIFTASQRRSGRKKYAILREHPVYIDNLKNLTGPLPGPLPPVDDGHSTYLVPSSLTPINAQNTVTFHLRGFRSKFKPKKLFSLNLEDFDLSLSHLAILAQEVTRADQLFTQFKYPRYWFAALIIGVVEHDRAVRFPEKASKKPLKIYKNRMQLFEGEKDDFKRVEEEVKKDKKTRESTSAPEKSATNHCANLPASKDVKPHQTMIAIIYESYRASCKMWDDEFAKFTPLAELNEEEARQYREEVLREKREREENTKGLRKCRDGYSS